MKREQEGLLLLLKEIDTICRNNGITYYVSGGTVIGAARHEGFIPWDDDIDVYMTRDNWNKFRDVMKTQTPNMRALECWENNDKFFNLLGRYMNKETTQIHQFQLYGNSTMGQLVDLFVLDPIINDAEAVRQYRSDVMLISDLMNDLVMYSNRWSSCDEYAALRDRIDIDGRSAVIKELIGRLEKYNEAESDCYILRWGGIPHLFPKEMFREPKYLKFEDMDVPVPTKMCEYLVQLYGLDWMYIPPHDEQLVHTDIFDPDQPYERFADLILPRVKNTETGAYLKNRKIEVFQNLHFTHNVDKERRLIEGEFIRRKLFNQIEEKNIDINNAAALGNPDIMWPLLKDYIRMQSHRTFIGGNDFLGYYKKMYPIYIDIGDELLSTALRIMIRDGRISKAARIMQVRQEEVQRPLAPCLASIADMMNGLRDVQTMFEFGQLEKAEERLNAIAKTESNIEVYKYTLEMVQRKDGSLSESYHNLLEECLSKWPDDGDFRKYKGDELFEKQEYKEAIEEYTKALLNSKNGLFALRIGKSIASHKDELLVYLENKISSTNDSAAITKAWKDVFENDPDIIRLFVKTHINRESITVLFEENVFIDDEEVREAICEAFADELGWNKDNVRFVLTEEGVIKADEQGNEFCDDGTDISKYINAVILQKNGDVKEAYQKYLKLLDSKDPYVSGSIRKKLDSDHKRFIKKKTDGDENYFKAEYALKYGTMPYEEYLSLLRIKERSGENGDADRTDSGSYVADNPWFRLLIELIGICEQNDIHYMLGGAILQYLSRNQGALPDDFSSMELIMDGANAKKLIKACEALPEDRSLECVLTNPKLRNIDMLYINTASTGVNFNQMDRRRSLGIAVTVRIARPQEKSSRRMTTADFDKFWLINYGYPYRVLKLTDEKDRKRNRRFLAKYKDGDKTTLKDFRNILKQEIREDTKVIYIYGNVTRVMHKASLWKERKETELFGVKVVVPNHSERYLTANYSTDSTYYDIPVMVIDETYTDHAGEKDIYLDDGFWEKLEKNRQLTFSKKDQSREHKYNWEMANDIYDGITIEDRLLKEIDRLRCIYGKKAYTEVINQMEGYWKVLRLKKKYQIRIDSDLEQLYLTAREKI